MENNVNQEDIAPIDVSNVGLENLIYIIREKQIMIDSDLAKLYQVEVRVLNQAVKRNIKRFPEEFMFQLTDDENENLKSQFVTSSSKSTHGGRRNNYYAFTEQGIAMLSSVLKSDVAIQVSINIMNAFVKMRRYMLNNEIIVNRLNGIELKHLEYKKEAENKFDEIFKYMGKNEEFKQGIFFKGETWDAYELIIDFIGRAKSSIVLIDNYVDEKTLSMLSKKRTGVNVKIITGPNSRLSTQDISRFNSQYPNLKYTTSRDFHDRFMILDNTTVYHIGASIKDAGKKCFAISKIEDERIIEDLLNRTE